MPLLTDMPAEVWPGLCTREETSLCAGREFEHSAVCPATCVKSPACLTVHSAATQMVGSNRTYGPTMPAEPGNGNDKKKDD